MVLTIGASASGVNDRIFVTTDEVDQEESNDRLYIMAADIIAVHNTFIEEVYSSLQAQHLSHFLPDELQTAYPSDVNDSSCIVGKLRRWFYTLVRDTHQRVILAWPLVAQSHLTVYKSCSRCIHLVMAHASVLDRNEPVVLKG